MTYREARRAWERQYFQALLFESGGNMLKAAAACGIHRTDFYKRLDRLGIARHKRKVNRGNQQWRALGAPLGTEIGDRL
jgi:DNA-binding NtrC family response regulator